MGRIAHDEWFKTAQFRTYVKLYEDEFIVMPNHVHGIIWIENEGDGDANAAIVRARRPRAPTDADHIERFGKPVPHSIPTIVRAYKSAVTYAANALQNQRGAVLWQRNDYEHVIRNGQDLQAKRDYILSNPLNWEDNDDHINRQK